MARYDVSAEESKQRAAKKTWPEELSERREEVLSVTLRNFEAAKQNLDDYAASEMLIRFHMAVVMSISREEKAYDEACREFTKVTNLPDDYGKNDESADGSPEARRTLKAQASYNLAVLQHRRLFEIMRRQTLKDPQGVARVHLEKLKKDLYNEAKDRYEKAGEEAGKHKLLNESQFEEGLLEAVGRAANNNESWEDVDRATWIAASFGRTLLESLYYHKPIPEFTDKTPVEEVKEAKPDERAQRRRKLVKTLVEGYSWLATVAWSISVIVCTLALRRFQSGLVLRVVLPAVLLLLLANFVVREIERRRQKAGSLSEEAEIISDYLVRKIESWGTKTTYRQDENCMIADEMLRAVGEWREEHRKRQEK